MVLPVYHNKTGLSNKKSVTIQFSDIKTKEATAVVGKEPRAGKRNFSFPLIKN